MRSKDEMGPIMHNAQSPQHPDKKSYKIKIGDREIIIGESDTRLVWEEDPVMPGIKTPRIVTEVTYHLDSDGVVFGHTSDVGICRFGCSVRKETIVQCNHCRAGVCRKHTIIVRTRHYCRKWPCSFCARLFQLFVLIYGIFKFCFISVTGLNSDEKGNQKHV